jgi:hypothetical protein
MSARRFDIYGEVHHCAQIMKLRAENKWLREQLVRLGVDPDALLASVPGRKKSKKHHAAQETA